MRRSKCIAAVFACLLFSLPALAQSAAKDEIATVTRALEGLMAQWNARNVSVARADLEVWRRRAAGTGDLEIILGFYVLSSAVAQRDGDRREELSSRVHLMLTRHAIEGALTPMAALENFELGRAFLRVDGYRTEGQFALMNALSVANAFVRAGADDREIIGVQARANGLLGQSMLQAGLPGAALYYLRLAIAQADAVRVSEQSKREISKLVDQAQASTRNIPPLAADVACDEAAQRDEQRRNACLSHADILWSKGDLAGAEDVLVRLAGSFTCMTLGAERLEIVRRLTFLRALREHPGERAFRDAVCAVANQVAGGWPTTAGLLAMPTIRAHIDRDAYDPEIADLAGHIAGRLSRRNDDLSAWHFMQTLSQLLEKERPPGDLSLQGATDLRRQQKLARSLIALDRAYLAERNGWAAAREIEHGRAIADAEAIDLQDIARLHEDFQRYWQDSYGFRTPTPAAAAEFYARVVLRLPAGEERRRIALTAWLAFETRRADEVRSARVAAELIEQVRRDGASERITLASLLNSYASAIRYTQPQVADNALREALAIYTEEGGYQSERLEAMLQLEADRRTLGDIVGAERFFNEAKTLRESARGLDESVIALFDMRHAQVLMAREQRTQALALAEDAMRRIEAATARTGNNWQRVSPASSMALFYAMTGHVQRARELYSEHILPWAQPSLVGDAMAIKARITLASLEAIYEPSPETVKMLQTQLANATWRARGERALQEAAWSSLAFAHLGLGAHREALEAARRSSVLKPPQGTQSQQSEMDRRLAETHVAAAWRASR